LTGSLLKFITTSLASQALLQQRRISALQRATIFPPLEGQGEVNFPKKHSKIKKNFFLFPNFYKQFVFLSVFVYFCGVISIKIKETKCYKQN